MYCQRHNLLDCLALTTLKAIALNNDSVAEELSSILLNWRGCLKQVKVVIVVAEDLHKRLSEFLNTLAKALNIPPEEIRIECAVTGSSRVLLSLPSEAAERLSNFQQQSVEVLPYTVHSVTRFQALDAVSQTAWRLATSQVQSSVEQAPIESAFIEGQSWQGILYEAQQAVIASGEEEQTSRSALSLTTQPQVSQPLTDAVAEQTAVTPSALLPVPNQTKRKNEAGGTFAVGGAAFGFLNTVVLMLVMGDGGSAIPRFINSVFNAHLYEWVAVAFGVSSSIVVHWLRDNDTYWSLWFAGGYGLGVPIAVMVLQPNTNEAVKTYVGNFLAVFLLSWLANVLLKSLKQSLTR